MKPYSISLLNEWKQCQRKFYGYRIEKTDWQDSFTKSLNLTLSSLVHKFFEEFYKKSDETLKFKLNVITLDGWKDEFVSAWNSEIEEMVSLTTETERKVFLEKGILSLKNFYKREKDRNFRFPVFTEKLFTVDCGEFKISGVIDRLDIEEDGSITIIDYTIQDYVKTVSQAENDLQLATYLMACEQDLLHKTPARVGFYYPIKGIEIFSEPNAEKQAELLTDIMQMDTAIHNRASDASLYPTSKDAVFCDSCGYKHKCPEFTHEFIEVKELPNYEEMEAICNEFLNISSQVNELDKRKKEVQGIIKEYMCEHGLKELYEVKLMSRDTGKYSLIDIWDILKKVENGYEFLDVKKKALKESLKAFSLPEQRIIENSYIPKSSIYPQKKPKKKRNN